MLSPPLANSVPDIAEAVPDIDGGVSPCVFHKRIGKLNGVRRDGCLICVSRLNSVSNLLSLISVLVLSLSVDSLFSRPPFECTLSCVVCLLLFKS